MPFELPLKRNPPAISAEEVAMELVFMLFKLVKLLPDTDS
jgi:hypothetical protein